MAGLSSEERKRALSFRVEHARAGFITCRWLLRQLLGSILGEPAERLCFQYSDSGKPELVGVGFGLSFNVSHSGNCGMIAVAKNSRVGVDIEEIRHIPELECLSRKFFSSAEAEAIHTRFHKEERRAFFACWTRKEALLKALGVGIGAGLDRFEVEVDPAAAQAKLRHDDFCSGSWRLHSFAFDGYMAAVAIEGHNIRSIRLFDWVNNGLEA
jgi:4'-phosphopantetheinyl transferase